MAAFDLPPGRFPGPPPEWVAELFGAAVPVAVRYADLLADAGIVRGLLGPREADRIWDRHLLNSALLADLIPAGATAADLGSGAGLPGIPLALARPDLHVTLVEPLLRRATFLAEVVDELSVLDRTIPGRIEVVRSRAEDLHGARSFDVVTARALAPVNRLVGWGMPLVAPGGVLLALKGSSAEREIDEASSDLAKRRLTTSVTRVERPYGSVTVVEVRRLS